MFTYINNSTLSVYIFELKSFLYSNAIRIKYVRQQKPYVGFLLSVVPATVRILEGKGVTIANGTKLKVADEGTRIALRCEAHGGRPTPSVSWYKNGEQLKGTCKGHLCVYAFFKKSI